MTETIIAPEAHPHDQSLWLVEQLRLTAFVTPAFQPPKESYFERVVGEAASTKVEDRKKGVLIEQGPFQGGILGMQLQPFRIDWILGADTDKEKNEEEITFEAVGEFDNVVNAFRETLAKWLVQNLPVKRLAFGAILLLPVESRRAGYERLSTILSTVKIDPVNSSDFLYQINRWAKSNEMAGMVINRLAKWAVAQKSLSKLAIPSFRSHSLGQTQACKLELDINTNAEFEGELPQAKLNPLFSELINFAKEIVKKGDMA